MYKNIFENKKLAIFDLDGTLTKTNDLWDYALIIVFNSLNHSDVDIDNTQGLYLEDRIYEILHNNNIKPQLTVKDILDLVKKQFTKLYIEEEMELVEGFWSLAAELKQDKGMKLALATNSDTDIAEFVIKREELANVFDFVIGGDKVKNTKPNPEIYRTVLKHFNIKSSEAIVFEDSPTGVKAAIGANIDPIVVWDTEKNYKDDFPKPIKIKLWIESFEDLVGNLDTTKEEELQQAQELYKQSQQN